MTRDPLLAQHWPASRVHRCLGRKDTHGLVRFLRERHQERSFKPIKNLKSTRGNMQGYGFAMMALCSLLVETIQSYRDGLPTTSGGELAHFRNLKNVPLPYRIPMGLTAGGEKAFRRFFRSYRSNFPGLGGVRFYRNIRNGLLHQAQTKGGWTLWKRGHCVWDEQQKRIFRDDFTEALEASFKDYLAKLDKAAWKSKLWTNAARKIWWLIRLSV